LTELELESRIAACIQTLAALKKKAPELRQKQLQQCLDNATEKGNSKAIEAIKNILQREAIRKRWRNVQWAVKPPSGDSITRLKVPTEDGVSVFATKQGVEEQAAAKLKECFQTARVAPICNDQLLEDFGYLGEKEATRKVLDGT